MMGTGAKDVGSLFSNVKPPHPRHPIFACAIPMLALILFGAVNTSAQGTAANIAPPKPNTPDQTAAIGEKKAPSDSIKVSVREVNVTVSVLDKKGLPVIPGFPSLGDLLVPGLVVVVGLVILRRGIAPGH